MTMAELAGKFRAREISVRKAKHKDNLLGHWVSLKGRAPLDTDVVLLYFHGGGYITGTPMMHAVAYQKLLLMLKKRYDLENVIIFAVKYPLTPEYPYPTQINTALDAYDYLVIENKVDAKRIIIGGDSAGGNLCLAMLQRLRDQEKAMPAGAMLISPWVELTYEVPAHATKADTRRDYLSPRCAKPFVEAFTGVPPVVDLSDPLVSPINAIMKDFPPIMVCWGGVELFREQIQQFVDNAKSQGVSVATYIDRDMPHVYAMLFDFYPSNAKRAMGRLARWIAEVSQGALVEDGGEVLVKGMVQMNLE